jgi:hypothetical protein
MKKYFTKKSISLLLTFCLGFTTYLFSQTAIPTGSFSTTCPDAGDPTWDNSVRSGAERIIVFLKLGSAITVGTPTNNYTTYTASSDLSSPGTGYQNDGAAKCIFKGTVGTVSLTNLTPGTTYFFLVFNTDAGTTYSSALTFSGATPSGPGDVSGLSAATGNGQSSVSWTNPTTCFDEVMIVGSTATIVGVPTGNGSAYTDNLSLGTGTAFGGGNVVYKGSSSPKTVTNLTNGLTYFFKVWARRGTTWSAGVQTSVTLPPSSISGGAFTATCTDAGDANWTNPVTTVYKIVVFAKAGSAITLGTPTANVNTYTANTTFGSGTAYENDASAFCVYNGVSNTVSLSNLLANTTYHFLAFNANGTNYSTQSTFNSTTLTSPTNVTSVGTTPGNGQIALNWTNPASCFDEVMVVAKESSAVTATPSGNGSAYTANAIFGSGTAIVANEYVVYKGAGAPSAPINVPITNLTNCTIAHFKIFTRKGSVWSSGAATSDTPISPVSISSLAPANSSINAATNTKLTLTFNQNVSISATGGSAAATSITITENGSAFQTIARGAGNISIAGNVVTVTINPLALNKSYDVVVGNKVFSACGSDFSGIATGNWTFTSSAGVTISPNIISACKNVYTQLGDIVITETAVNNFQGNASSSQTMILKFNTSGFAFKPGVTGVTVLVAGGGDILPSSSATTVGFSSSTITINFPAGVVRTKPDAVTIKGLQVTADGSNASSDIVVEPTSTMTVEGITPGSTALATVNVNVGIVPPAPVFSSGTLAYCVGSNISGQTVSVTAANPVTWYSDSGLSNLLFSGSTANLQSDLGISSAASGITTVYAAQINGCISPGLPVTFTINANPGADPGTFATTQCSGNLITLGGAPTASVPSSPPYIYTWTEQTGNYTGGVIASTPNPQVTINNNTGLIKNYQFKVVITDGNLCSANSVNNFNVFPYQTPFLTQPSSTTFNTNSPPQELIANFTSISFNGVGVIQTNPTTWKFDPTQAYDDTKSLPQFFDIHFVGTDPNNCPVNTNNTPLQPLATIALTNNTFSFVENQYCSVEVPYPSPFVAPTGSGALVSGGGTATAIDLTISGTTKTALTTYTSDWNATTRLNFTFTIPNWTPTIYYLGDLVYYAGEVYRARSNFNSSTIPPGDPGNWVSGAFTLQNTWAGPTSGLVRNYYEKYFGSNQGGPTVVKSGTKYYMYTNPNYVNCSDCSYLYPSTYLEFQVASDVRFYIQQYNAGRYYYADRIISNATYPGSVVNYQGRIFKCLKQNDPTNPQVPVSNATTSYWQDVSSIGFDLGYVFYDVVNNKSGFAYFGQYVPINRNPAVSFTGITSGQDICQASPDITLTSNLQSGSIANAGYFEISFDKGTTWLKDVLSGGSVVNSNSNPTLGIATLKANQTWIKATSVASSQNWNIGVSYSQGDNVTIGTLYYTSITNGNIGKNPSTNPAFWQANSLTVDLRLFYDPQTKGSLGQACSSTSQLRVVIHQTPILSFKAIPTTTLCNYDPTSYPIDTNPTSNANVLISGFGITSTGNGTAKLDAFSAFSQSITAGGNSLLAQNIIATATITDIYGCTNTATNNSYTVNKPVIASFSISNITGGTKVYDNSTPAGQSVDFCYSDNKRQSPGPGPAFIKGVQPNSYYTLQFVLPSNPAPDNYGLLGAPLNHFSFEPKAKYDSAVNKYGANNVNTIIFNLTYTAYDGNNCTTSLPPVALKVAPSLQVDIAGINDGDVFCANEGNKILTLSNYQSGVSFSINSSPKILNSNKYVYDLSFDAIANQSITPVALTYNVPSGNNCSNQITKNISILASPTASFNVNPRCDQDKINYNGIDASINSSFPTTYNWNFQDVNPIQKTGPNTQYQFSGTGTFAVSLTTDYNTVTVGAFTKTCTSTTQEFQKVGAIPKIDFAFSNVCNGDATNFVAQQTQGNDPVTSFRWDFKDGVATVFGLGASTITGYANTAGTYKAPIHTYLPNIYTVTVIGQTAVIAGSCVDTVTRVVSILKTQTITPASIYEMKNLSGGNGDWVIEDRGGNSNWIFSGTSPDGTTNLKQAWNNVNNLGASYKTDDQSYMNSPCFDMSAYTKPAFSMDYFMDVRPQQDGAVLQYSTDVVGGIQVWNTIGSTNSGLNWYNTQGISGKPGEGIGNPNPNFYGLSRSKDDKWLTAKHTLDEIASLATTKRKKVRFRIAFGSDLGSTNGAKGFAFNNVTIVDRNRISLIENFTNSKLATAVDNNSQFKSFLLGNTEIVKLQYNIGLPKPDDINLQNSEDPNARAAFYGITNSPALIPRGYLDGRSDGDFTINWLTKAFALRSLSSSPVTIAITNPTSVTATATASAAIPAGNLRFFIALIEKTVGADVFVVRKLFPTAAGEVVPVPLAKSQTVTLTASPWTIATSQIGDINQLAAVAFIQDIDTKEVVQASYLPGLTSLPAVVTGIEPLTENDITIFPNPANQEFTLQLPKIASRKVAIKLIDQLGKEINTYSIGLGEKEQTISTRDLAAAIYILQIETAQGTVRKKVMVAH